MNGTADLCVVGGGFSGLWTAILAKERDPSRDVVLLEGNRIGWAASGRNGGFCAASLTHGHANGVERWPDEIDTLERLGEENLDAIEETLERYAVDCDFERPGAITVATEPHQLEWLREMVEADPEATYLDEDAMRAEVSSPTFLAGVLEPHGMALVDPARLAWGLAAAAESLGVRIHEGTHVAGHRARGSGARRAHRPRRGRAGGQGGARDQRLPVAGPPDPAAHGAGLRLRADDRAAVGRAAATRSAGTGARAWTT